MHPAWSVILLTTLIGAGQGLFLALFAAEALAPQALPQPAHRFLALGGALSVALLAAGLFASFFHLGRPERAWRSAAMWRTSWLSREVIALPLFMALVFAWGVLHWVGKSAPWVGALAVLACIALFVCTAMIYACLPFLQEWRTPLTVVNYVVLGCASGLTLAAAYAAYFSGTLAGQFAEWAIAVTLAGLATRGASLVRNARLKPKSTLQSAIGVSHPRIAQKAQGAIAGSFNTREFFHGRAAGYLRNVKWGFLVLGFAVPVLLLATGARAGDSALLHAAFVAQFAGLLAERWFFFAQANHPQNLYYQAVS